MLYRFLSWLSGKNLYIFGAVSLTNTFLAAKGLYDAMTAAYIQSLLTLFSGGAELKTTQLGINRK